MRRARLHESRRQAECFVGWYSSNHYRDSGKHFRANAASEPTALIDIHTRPAPLLPIHSAAVTSLTATAGRNLSLRYLS